MKRDAVVLISLAGLLIAILYFLAEEDSWMLLHYKNGVQSWAKAQLRTATLIPTSPPSARATTSPSHPRTARPSQATARPSHVRTQNPSQATASPSQARTASPLKITGSPSNVKTSSPSAAIESKPAVSVSGSPSTALALPACKVKLVDSRDLSPWNCTLVEFQAAEQLLPFSALSTDALDVLEKKVSLITEQNWGQLCNKMGMIAGALHIMTTKKQLTTNLLALYSVQSWSLTAYALDLEALSSRLPGVLMDCASCPGSKEFIRCSVIIIKGKLYDVSSKVFRVDELHTVSSLFHRSRPRNYGFMEELVQSVRPKKILVDIVRRYMTGIQSDAHERGYTSVGMHRRSMDSMCYIWMQQEHQFNCASQQDYRPLSDRWGRFITQNKAFYLQSDYFRNSSIPLEVRGSLEQQHPMLMTCNFSLSDTQVSVLNRTWPVIFQKPFVLGVADDRRWPEGLVSIQRSSLPKRLFDLASIEPSMCFMNKKHQFMLADMLMMSMTDLHMGNPLSSCDDIVTHWRRLEGFKKGSSYPQFCYDGFYA